MLDNYLVFLEYETYRDDYIYTSLLGSLSLSCPDRFFSIAKEKHVLVKKKKKMFSAE